jgi:O-antigen/teichoic acid export membrane protein
VINLRNSIGIDSSPAKTVHFFGRSARGLLSLTPEAIWVLVGQAGTAIAALAGIKLLTHVLDPSEFGRLALANTLVSLLGINLFGPLGQGLMRFWSISKDRGNLDAFYIVSNRLFKYASLIALLTTTIFSFILSKITSLDWALLVTLSLAVGTITGLTNLRISIFTATRQRQRTAILNISNTFLKPLAATFLVVLIIPNANMAIVGYLLAGLFVLLITNRLYSQAASVTFPHHLRSGTRAHLFRGLGKEILSYSLPFFVWGAFGWIHMSCDRWSLQTFHGPGVVGPFAVVSLLAMYPLNFGSAFLDTLFSPIAFQRAGDLMDNNAIDSANRMLLIMTGIYVLGALVLIGFFAFFHRPVILFISSQRFVRFSHLLPGLTAAWAFFFLGQLSTQFGLLLNKPQIYIIPKLSASLVAAATTFYFSFKIGPSGIVWGLAIAGLIYAGSCTVINLTTIPFFLLAERNEVDSGKKIDNSPTR